MQLDKASKSWKTGKDFIEAERNGFQTTVQAFPSLLLSETIHLLIIINYLSCDIQSFNIPSRVSKTREWQLWTTRCRTTKLARTKGWHHRLASNEYIIWKVRCTALRTAYASGRGRKVHRESIENAAPWRPVCSWSIVDVSPASSTPRVFLRFIAAFNLAIKYGCRCKLRSSDAVFDFSCAATLRSNFGNTSSNTTVDPYQEIAILLFHSASMSMKNPSERSS